MENILVYGGMILALAGGIFGFLKFTAFMKAKAPDAKQTKIGLYSTLGGVVALALGLGSFFYGLIEGGSSIITDGSLLMGTIGAILTILLVVGMALAFIVHYYKKDASTGLHTWSFRVLLFGIIPLILSFLMMMEGYDVLIDFPLNKGIIIGGRQIVTFYAMFILGGAFLVYVIDDHQLHMEGYRKGILENVFYVAFPAGIVGSRIWYVIGQWESEFADREFWHVFAMWEGGLTIIGGALFGIIVGVWFVKVRRKEMNLLHVMDVIVPTILVAQGIGRWGNFFNQEVYGAVTDPAKWWFLPNFIIQQMTIGGEMRVPLFLIESIANLAGYFFIRYAVGVGLKKYILLGDLAALYPIWYGITRAIMEPMRDPSYIMDDWWSLYGSYGMIAIGVLAIVYLHVSDYLKKKKAKDINHAQGSPKK